MLSYKLKIFSVKIGFFFQEITFITEFPRKFATNIFNRWQMGFLGGKFATVNFEPCKGRPHGDERQKMKMAELYPLNVYLSEQEWIHLYERGSIVCVSK